MILSAPKHRVKRMGEDKGLTRRYFVKGSAAALTASLVVKPSVARGEVARAGPSNGPTVNGSGNEELVPHRPLGKTGVQVSVLGVGGYHLGSIKDQSESNELVSRALAAGINFFDNCWEYHDGVSEERLGSALKGRRDSAFLMTKVCTHGRSKDVAIQQLEESLRRLQTDHLDLWQIHEVVYYNDPDMIFAPNGAAEALLEAKKQGKVRFIGFTGHKNPAIHLKMLSHDFPFDTVQMPLNALDGTFKSFEQQVLPEANRKGIAVLGMKSLGGSGEIVSHGALTAEDGLRYAMSLPVATTISGMDSLGVLEQNLRVARGFKALSADAMQALRESARALAADGRYELFKTTTKYDGKIGRQQHHYPPVDKLPA
jgi:aryl-alcohol dehydrogenase-like predicted oxidoreductase